MIRAVSPWALTLPGPALRRRNLAYRALSELLVDLAREVHLSEYWRSIIAPHQSQKLRETFMRAN
jgi:hypothetical protein